MVYTLAEIFYFLVYKSKISNIVYNLSHFKTIKSWKTY